MFCVQVLEQRQRRNDEIGEPVLEAVLEPGDVLYMPRGCIHQAYCSPGDHSLHVTLSTNQFNTWADLLEVAFPAALRAAAAEVPALRRCPPPDYLAHLGVRAANVAEPPDDIHFDPETDVVNPRRDDLIGAFNELAQAVMRRLPLDAAADAIGAGFMRQRLPPPPSHVSAPVAASGPDAAGTVTDACMVPRAGGGRAARRRGRRRHRLPPVRRWPSRSTARVATTRTISRL